MAGRDPGRDRGRDPVSAPPAVGVALGLAVLVTAAGGYLLYDAFAAGGLVTGTSWASRGAAGLDGLAPGAWTLPAGLLAGLIGLAWLAAALLPRRRRELAVGTQGHVWLRPRDAATMVRARVHDLPGVLQARASGGRRTLRVELTTTRADREALSAEATAAAEVVLGALTPRPQLRVSVRSKGLS